MLKGKNRAVLEQLLDLLDTACAAVPELRRRFDAGDAAAVERLLGDLESAAEAVGLALEPLLPELEHSYAAEQLDNVADTLGRVGAAIRGGRRDRAAVLMDFQLLPFLRQLRESLYFWGAVFPDRARMKRYYAEEFAAHYRNPCFQTGARAPYRLSVAVPAYNHLDMTKRCLDRLRRETDFEKLNAELILIDHGSSDGTLDYFESLGVEKVLRFKNNARLMVFPTMFQACQGEYFAYVSNDVLVTRGWAELLMECLDSDPSIIAAVPETPNISNLQMTEVPTDDPEEFIAWANARNRHDPSKWSDRARLMPPLGMYRARLLDEIGFADPLFYSMEFWDDDLSLRARRAGYRQLVCGDVACYHFGSVTGGDAQKKEGTLVYGRELFRQKNGVDPWSAGCCYDPVAVDIFRQLFPPEGTVRVLGLDCGMGDTPMQMRNVRRRLGWDCEIYQLTSRAEYLPDLLPWSREALYRPRLEDGLAEDFPGVQFSCAYLGRDIAEYEDISGLLEAVSRRLLPGGCLIFPCANPFFAETLHALLAFSLPEGAVRRALADPARVRAAAEEHFSMVRTAEETAPLEGAEGFAARHFGAALPEARAAALGIRRYYFVCGK